MNDLTAAQKEAVTTWDKNILVSAGAGTGKTKVLVERFVQAIVKGRALVTEILALTFTEKAAAEMKYRISLKLNELGLESARRDLESAYISTIHSFASRILKEHPIESGVDPDFSVLEDEESEMLKDLALDEVIELGCKDDSGTFDLLKMMGESAVRRAVLKVYQAAITEGLPLAQFFERSHAWQKDFGVAKAIESKLSDLFEKTQDPQIEKEWKTFPSTTWTWQILENFKTWSKYFYQRGGKNNKATWKEIAELSKNLRAAKVEELSEAWRQKFEILALRFELQYQKVKTEKNVLDFDDLQVKVVEMFEANRVAGDLLLERYQKLFKLILIDEFQDTNLLQVKLIEKLSFGNNLFFVGDFKQSIYNFRGTSPEYFLERDKRYRNSKKEARIALLDNYRSEKPVLELINTFFKQLWQEDNLPVEDLIANKEASDKVADNVEALITKREDEESLDHARLREAGLIAERIKELIDNGTLPGDIVILFQAMTHSALYEYALKKLGIPYFVVAGRGFYQQPEIRDTLQLLACLDNPLHDVALAATLRAPFFHITDNTLFWLAHFVKSKNEFTPLYEAIQHFEQIEPISEDEKPKLEFFRNLLNELIQDKDRIRVSELIEKILSKTTFELSVLADVQGIRRYANLRKLIDLAREYELHEWISISNFIHTIRHLETREIRESEAQIETEKGGDSVRLMTIHKAKGLEFPVVIIADMAHLKQGEEGKDCLASSSFGYALRIKNEVSKSKEEPASWFALDQENKQRERAEWKRLFYVAATRAKSRLIFSGVLTERKEKKENIAEMNSWMEWLMAVLAELPDHKVKMRYAPLQLEGRENLPLAEKKAFEKILTDFVPPPLEEWIKAEKTRLSALEECENIHQRVQPLDIPPSRVLDLPVSAYVLYQRSPQDYRKRYEIGYPDRCEKEDAFDEILDQDDEAIDAREFGVAMHRVLEYFDFKDPQGSIQAGLKSLAQAVPESQLKQAREILNAWVQAPLFRRLAAASKVYRELPFVFNERHGRIQGVLDVLFQDQKGWHILDYKNAEGDESKMSEMGYDFQLLLYAYVFWQLFKQVPQTAIVYFLKNQKSVEIQITQQKLEAFGDQLRQMQEMILGHCERTK